MGHRGNTYQSNAPENSIKGIESCIALNGIVNVVEIDPRRTKMVLLSLCMMKPSTGPQQGKER